MSPIEMLRRLATDLGDLDAWRIALRPCGVVIGYWPDGVALESSIVVSWDALAAAEADDFLRDKAEQLRRAVDVKAYA